MNVFVQSLKYTGISYICRYVTEDGDILEVEVDSAPKYGWNSMSESFTKLSLIEQRDTGLLTKTIPASVCYYSNADVDCDDNPDFLFYYTHNDNRECQEKINLDLYKVKYQTNLEASLVDFVYEESCLYHLRKAANVFHTNCEQILTTPDTELISILFPGTEFYTPKHLDEWRIAKSLLDLKVLERIPYAPPTLYVQLIYSSLTDSNEMLSFEELAIEEGKVCDTCSTTL